jgi:hypothetical protein
MTKNAKALAFIAGLFAVVFSASLPACAQQNPFVGTWSSSLMLPQGGGGVAYLDLYPDGTFHLAAESAGPPGSGVSSGFVWHFCGRYQFNQSVLETTYLAYSPHLCGMGMCEPPPVPLNRPQMSGYTFPNLNELQLSDGTHYVRAPANPFPLPPNGCSG